MDETQLRELQSEIRSLRETITRDREGPRAIFAALESIRLPGPTHVVDATRARIAERLAPALPFKEGKVDQEKLGQMVEAAALEEARFLATLGFGTGVASMGQRMSEAEIKKLTEDDGKKWEEQFEESMSRLADVFVGKKINEGEQTEGERMARKRMRRIFKEGRAA
jgi:hypothetical protein